MPARLESTSSAIATDGLRQTPRLAAVPGARVLMACVPPASEANATYPRIVRWAANANHTADSPSSCQAHALAAKTVAAVVAAAPPELPIRDGTCLATTARRTTRHHSFSVEEREAEAASDQRAWSLEVAEDSKGLADGLARSHGDSWVPC